MAPTCTWRQALGFQSKLILQNKLLLVLIERCHRKASDPTKTPQWARDLKNWSTSNERRTPGLKNQGFLTSGDHVDGWVWGGNACLENRKHQDALCKPAEGVLCWENHGSWHPRAYLSIVWEHIHSNSCSHFRQSSALLQEHNAKNGLRSTAMSLRCSLGLQIPQISIQSDICRFLQQFQFLENLPKQSDHADRSCSRHLADRHHSKPLGV